MKKLFLAMSLFCVLSCTQNNVPVYLNEVADIEDRVEDALSRMTVEEKLGIIHAQSKFSARGVPRLGIPDIWMDDGPSGVREESFWDDWGGAGWTNDSCTAHPALTCLAATWNEEMAALFGKSIGEEARYRNKTTLLAPGVNIMRTPLCGRNFEYMGEDPVLAGKMCVPYIQNLQKNGVAACVKHFALNNQEAYRHSVNVVVDDRALYEIYLPAFKAAVQEGNSWTIMGAYNKYKGQYCCHNQYLLNDILKGEWGYDGVVVSDWGGVEDTWEGIHNGLDMEFGTGSDGLSNRGVDTYDSFCLANPYRCLIREGKVGTDELDEKARRVLRLIFRTTMSKDRPWGSFATQEHYDIARKVAEEGIVLLQNENEVLPLRLDKKPIILVTGANAFWQHASGGGSSYLKTTHEICPLDGLKEIVGNRAEIRFVEGYRPFTGEYPDYVAPLREEAVKAAAEADYVIVFGGLNKWGHQDCEGVDRDEYGLPFAQNELIEALSQVNDNVIVSLTTGTAVAMPWKDKVQAILYNWYIGSEGGRALANILTGAVSPSGKLPFTIAERLEDYAPHALDAYDSKNSGDVEYKEGIFVGYRWFDKEGVKPLFPFGYGLGYSSFSFGRVEASSATVRMTSSEVAPDFASEKRAGNGNSIKFRVDVTNTGNCRAAETVQLYVRDMESSLPRPLKELKAFRKVWLDAGQTETVELTLSEKDLRFFDDSKHKWVEEPGDFQALIGTSSEDIFSIVDFRLK